MLAPPAERRARRLARRGRAPSRGPTRVVGAPLERSVLYELHVGTFTAEGDVRRASSRKLGSLRDSASPRSS